MESTSRPEKRRLEEDDFEGPSKRQTVGSEETQSNDVFYEAPTAPADEEYEPTSFAPAVKQEEKQEEEEEEAEKDKQQEEQDEEYEPTAYVKQENYEPVKEEDNLPVETIIPFDRLVVLHLEATCDENPTNPAAVQVTKENSEIIGNY